MNQEERSQEPEARSQERAEAVFLKMVQNVHDTEKLQARVGADQVRLAGQHYRVTLVLFWIAIANLGLALVRLLEAFLK